MSFWQCRSEDPKSSSGTVWYCIRCWLQIIMNYCLKSMSFIAKLWNIRNMNKSKYLQSYISLMVSLYYHAALSYPKHYINILLQPYKMKKSKSDHAAKETIQLQIIYIEIFIIWFLRNITVGKIVYYSCINSVINGLKFWPKGT